MLYVINVVIKMNKGIKDPLDEIFVEAHCKTEFKSWEQLKFAVKEARGICDKFYKKYKLWNYTGFTWTIFYGNTVGSVDLRFVNLKTGEAKMEYYINHSVIEDKQINLKDIFKK